MELKITFELTRDASVAAALNAGAPNDETAELMAMGIQRRSRFTQKVKNSQQYKVLAANQNNGYMVIEISPCKTVSLQHSATPRPCRGKEDTLTASDLKHALKLLGWTQAQLAEKLGVDLATVSRWANGHLPVPQYAVSYMELAIKVKDFSDDCCQPR